MQLWLDPHQASALLREARQRLPEEACGLLAGRDGRVHRIVTIDNVAALPTQQFRMNEQQLVRSIFDIERKGLELYAIWHSHPRGEPLPSPTDVREAAWPELCQLIVGLGQAEPQLAAWRIAEERVTRIPLHTGFSPPAPVTRGESQAQRHAILLSAAMAVLLGLWLALTLLPPAPALP